MKTIYLTSDHENYLNMLEEIVKALGRGEIVVLPTETVYITAVDATNKEAVSKLVAYKNRPFGKPFSVAVTNVGMAGDYVELNETALNLYRNFLPGPVTVVSRGKHKVAYGIESEAGTLGIRIPGYPLVLEVVRKLGKPITATSANASYQKRPYKIDDIFENLSRKQKGLIDLVVDVGELPHNEPSTVVDTTLDDVVVLRQGDIKLKERLEVVSLSEEGTQNIGKELWQKYEQHFGERAIVFALEGEMGAGKTQFVKGLAKAMGIKDQVVSPTYTLEEEYNFFYDKKKARLVHVDTWKIESNQEIEELGLGNFISDKSVLAIEWADKIETLVRKYNEEAVIVWVKIEYGKRENERKISWGVM